ncbi:helix-turn-helix domain-containing protein [Paenibacillus sedimenti]|uniref:Helix-turn-helix domain-containing protein n=1 Tax=Paenibacillus sedimenti TaxID=2770274 RepID=A0A926QJ67_9BACL|nr:helix-turn-helix domain-containing protein [Paenibacillus sedimenti]MBD0381250.1 helix-turn-helix domain-containing protein [Paenibacillus sedimenti]
MSLGERIKERRASFDLKQDECAEQVGVTRAVLSSYERNVSMPPGDVLGKLATVLKTSSDFLLGLTDDPTPPITNEKLSEDEVIKKKFLLEMEDILRKNSNVDEEKLRYALKFFQFTVEEDIEGSKRKKSQN